MTVIETAIVITLTSMGGRMSRRRLISIIRSDINVTADQVQRAAASLFHKGIIGRTSDLRADGTIDVFFYV